MFCNNCGASLPDNTTFCSNCGHAVQPAASTGGAQSAAGPSGAAAGAQPARSAGQPRTDGKAAASLVLGILSLLIFSFLAGIPAVILGHLSRKSIRESMGRLKGEGMALAGLIMGYLSIATIPMVLIIAAIAIPNLLRARMSANTSAAASTMRILNTGQVTYSATYPARGYARDLTTLGPGPSDQCNAPSETYACLVDAGVANVKLKNGFRYSMSAVCGSDGVCTDYVLVATPVNETTGTQSFCSTADAVIRSNRRVPLAVPPTTVEECQAWPPL